MPLRRRVGKLISFLVFGFNLVGGCHSFVSFVVPFFVVWGLLEVDIYTNLLSGVVVFFSSCLCAVGWMEGRILGGGIHRVCGR